MGAGNRTWHRRIARQEPERQRDRTDAAQDRGDEPAFDRVSQNGVSRPAAPLVLTPREAEVLRRIVAGQHTQQMVREMNIAISTLRTYIKNVFAKLGVHSRLEAAAFASRVSLPDRLDDLQRNFLPLL